MLGLISEADTEIKPCCQREGKTILFISYTCWNLIIFHQPNQIQEIGSFCGWNLIVIPPTTGTILLISWCQLLAKSPNMGLGLHVGVTNQFL